MSPQEFSFNLEEFERIFPFYIQLNNELKITSCGKSIRKILSDYSDTTFQYLFELDRPKVEYINFETLKKLDGSFLLLTIKGANPIKFRGQINYHSSQKTLLIIGAPWFESTETLEASGLVFNDFGINNPMIDLLLLLKTQEIANDELKEVVLTISEQKKKIDEANNEIKKIVQSIEESNLRYEFVSKATSDAIWDLDLNTGKMYHGKGFSRLFGQDSDIFLDNNLWESYIHPDDLERVKKNVANSIRSKKDSWIDEFRYLRKDGSFATVVDRAYIIRNEEGKGIRMIGAMKDISKEKQEEFHLKLLESVISNLNDSVVITEASPNQPIIYSNEAFAEMTGYSFEEIKDQPPKFLHGPNTDRKLLQELENSMEEGGDCRITVINYKKDGSEFWNNISMSPLMNESQEITHWIFIERDVTEEVKADEALANQKKFTEDILNNIPADIAVFDKNHNYLFLNPQAIKNKETRDWLIGKNDFDYANHKGIDDTIARARREIFNKTVDSNATFEWIDEHKKENGSNFILRKFYPYFENNKLKFVIGYGVDITEQKLIEIQLNKALEDIQKTNEELEQFAYVASHDLQEPLRMVTSFLSQLEKKYSSSLDEKAREYIYYAVDGAKRMRQIILDLLEFSRVGKSEEKIKEINIKEVIEEIKILHSKQIEELKATIICNDLHTIKGYKTPLRQVFQNLIGNSLKYHQKEIAPIIEINTTSLEKEWQFSVKDNGIGIDAEFFDKIFTIFQRLHNKDEYSGTGIGLAITKKIIENQGGKIWLTSEEKKGSTFYFTLPK